MARDPPPWFLLLITLVDDGEPATPHLTHFDPALMACQSTALDRSFRQASLQ